MKKTRREVVQTFYNNFAKNYEQNRYASDKQKKADECAKAVVMELVGDVKYKTVLECGCGTGRFADRFVQQGAKVVGMDISENMVEIAKKKIPSAEFIIGDLFSIPIRETQFDIVVCSQVLTHLHEYKKPLLEMKRITKENGIIVIDIRNMLWPFRPIQILKQKLGRDDECNPHYTHLGNIGKICNEIGLEIEEFRGVGALGSKKYIAPTIILKIRKSQNQEQK